MSSLVQSKVEKLTSGASRLPEQEIQNLLAQLPDWQLIEENGEKHLRRSFDFKNFRQALDFTNQVGDLAEQADHHPRLVTEWGKVTVDWWTHSVRGLHKNDFIMAAKTGRLRRG